MFSFESKKLVRKMRPTTRLSLEVLEDRSLPSVSTLPVSVTSPPAAAQNPAVASFVDSMMGQWNNLLATIQQDVLAAYQSLGQEIAQEASTLGLQLDQILGISPSAAKPSSHTAPPQPTTYGTTTANHASMRALPSSANTTGKELPQAQHSTRQTNVLSAPAPGAIGVSGYLWDPPNPANDDNASTPGNWWYNGNVRATTKPGTNPGDPVTFDPGNGVIQDKNGNAAINWDYNAANPIGSMHVGGKLAYTGVQTILSGIKVELKGVDSLGQPTASLGMNTDDAFSSLNLKFTDGTTRFWIDNDATITSMDLTGDPLGRFNVIGGTTTMAQSTFFTEKLGVSFIVWAGAEVYDKSYIPIQLTANVIISVDGNMYFDWGPNNGIELISGGGTYTNSDIVVSGRSGFLVYKGNQNVKDTITVAILIKDGGTLRVTVDPSSPTPTQGELIVQGTSALGYSVTMQGTSSEVELSNGDTLQCVNGYIQYEGTLATGDATKCYLIAGANNDGEVNIAGGSVTINSSTVGYGNLAVEAATLDFNGALAVAIDATNPNNRDLLSVLSNKATTINLQANSTLLVFVNNGIPAPGQKWVIIQGFINPIIGNFANITTVPAGINLTGKVDPDNLDDYILTS